MQLRLTVNAILHVLDVPPNALLVDVLRDALLLKGTHIGCDTAQCGACTVLVNGAAVKSCNVLAAQVDGASVATVEGLKVGDAWHPIQLAFSKHHALQCGYCTPGMIMRAVAMVDEGVPAERGAVAQALAGNLCRCTGYEGIVNAVCEALPQMRAARNAAAAGA